MEMNNNAFISPKDLEPEVLASVVRVMMAWNQSMSLRKWSDRITTDNNLSKDNHEFYTVLGYLASLSAEILKGYYKMCGEPYFNEFLKQEVSVSSDHKFLLSHDIKNVLFKKLRTIRHNITYHFATDEKGKALNSALSEIISLLKDKNIKIPIANTAKTRGETWFTLAETISYNLMFPEFKLEELIPFTPPVFKKLQYETDMIYPPLLELLGAFDNIFYAFITNYFDILNGVQPSQEST